MSLGIQHVPWGYLKANFTGYKKKWFLLFIRFPDPRVAAQTHVVLFLTKSVPLRIGFQNVHLKGHTRCSGGR